MSQPMEIDDADWSHDPSDQYHARRRLEFALSVLSTDDRILVTLAELEGWKTSELAELYSLSEGAVKMRLSRARTKMRERLSSVPQVKNMNTVERKIDVCCAQQPRRD